MISIEQGLRMISSRADAVVGSDFMATELVSLPDCIGRVLRDYVYADADSPPFIRSIRDGFAVQASDVKTVPAELDVIGESRAGRSFVGTIRSSQCCEIMTGAEVPDGADAVVMVEDTERLSDTRVRILRSIISGRSVQAVGAECRKGDLILEPGRKIQAGEIGILASLGCAEVRVSKKPRVAIVSTGDELVEVDQTPGPAEIRNSNSITLFAQVVGAGGDPTMLGIAGDAADDLRGKLLDALHYDVVITSGGVSMGKYDLVEDMFAEFGVEIAFDEVAMKPGKPTVFGWKNQTFVFGLPGNPVSTIVSFQLFVRPLIHRLLQLNDYSNNFLEAVLTEKVRCDPTRAACVPAEVSFENGQYRLELVSWKGSSDLVGLSRANSYVLIPCQDGFLGKGTNVRFIPTADLGVSGER